MAAAIKALSVTGLMRQAAHYNAHRTAIIYKTTSLTFAEAWSRGTRMANALLSLGLRPGDRIGVLEDNSIEAQDFFLGAAIAGLVRVPLYARNSVESHAHMLSHTGCRAVVVAKTYETELSGLTDQLAVLEHIIVRAHDYENWLLGFSDEDPDLDINPDDWFIIRHTGGTTGKPKGVGYSHRSWLAAGRDWFYNFRRWRLAMSACTRDRFRTAVVTCLHRPGYRVGPTFSWTILMQRTPSKSCQNQRWVICSWCRLCSMPWFITRWLVDLISLR